MLDLAYLTGQRPSDAASLARRGIRSVRDLRLDLSKSRARRKLHMLNKGELGTLIAHFAERSVNVRVHGSGAIVNAAVLLDEYRYLLEQRLAW